MAEKVIDGFSVVAYATQPQGRQPARAYLETRRIGEQEDSQPFEIFVARRFRNAIEAMSAARNALDCVRAVDDDGVPEPLPN